MRMTEDEIWDALTEVYDPELGIDIVNLGLIYDVSLSDKAIALTMTLTFVGCPLQEMIEEEVRSVLASDDRNVLIAWTFSPLWTVAYMTDEGKAEFQAMGGKLPYG